MTEINFRNRKDGLTKEQKEFIIKNYSTMRTNDICRIIGVEYNQVHGYASNLHITKNDFDYYYNIRKNKKSYSYLNHINKKKEEKVTELYKSKYGKYEVNNNYFNKIDNEFKAYWLGFLYADCYNDVEDSIIELTLKKDDEIHVLKFLDSVQSNAPVKYKSVRNFMACKTNVCNRDLSQSLHNLGCTQNKSLTLKFPDNKIVPKPLMRHFIRGFFDGDGCIHVDVEKKKCSVGFCSNYDFCLHLRDYIANELSLTKVVIREDTRSKACQICWEGATNSYKIFKYLYKNSNISLNRKLEKFDIMFCLD